MLAGDVTVHVFHGENALIPRIQARSAGWQGALSELLAFHRGALYRRCRVLLGDPRDAEDALQ